MNAKSRELIEKLLISVPKDLITENIKLDNLLIDIWRKPTSELSFTMAIAEMLNLEDANNFPTLLSFIHSLYTSAVLFDDVVDQDRDIGESLENDVATGTNIALTLLTFSYNTLLKFCQASSISTEMTINLLGVVFNDCFSMARTQTIEFEEASCLISEDYYLARSLIKGGNLLGIVCYVLGTLASLSNVQKTKLKKFGQSVGLVSQLFNDLDSCVTGDLRRNSLARGIITLPIIYANDLLDPENKLKMEKLFNKRQKTETEMQELAAILVHSGAFLETKLRIAAVLNDIHTMIDKSDPFQEHLLNLLTKFQGSLTVS